MKVSTHPLYHIWNGMVRRCRDPKNVNYPRWGARGIDCLDEWAVKGERGTKETPSGFLAFLSYVEENLGERPEGYSIDRIDNSIGYFPGNIRWANQSQQNFNRDCGKLRCIKRVPSGKFQVNIRYNKRSFYLGTYDIMEDAIVARDEKMKELGV